MNTGLRYIANKSSIVLFLAVFFSLLIQNKLLGQAAHYWSQNFNEESSLLSGAVVGGGAGNSSVYYNPASIAENEGASLAVNASLFSLNSLAAKNALGDEINLSSLSLTIQPRFISYSSQPKKVPRLRLEFVVLNNQLFDVSFNNSVSYQMDILKSLPGEERYIGSFIYSNYYREDWIGGGGSYQVNDHFFLGASMFVKVKAFRYSYIIDLQAYPLQDTIEAGGTQIPFYSASYNDYQYLKFNNYRLVWKFSMFYKKNNYSFGMTLTTPSLNVYSDGKRVSKKYEQSNITNPDGDGWLSNIMVIDFKQMKDVNVNFKDPMSIAVGAVIRSKDNRRALYTTLEYFFPIDAYKIVQVDADPLVTNEQTYANLPAKEFSSYAYGNHWVLNAAIGSSWQARDNLKFLAGFRTDFNYQNNFNYGDFLKFNTLRQIKLDKYHVTGGAVLTIKGQDIMIGLQYTLGVKKHQLQILNLTDPVEYNTVEGAALQGTRQYTMTNLSNELGLFFGATFNFMTGKNKEKEVVE